MVGSISGDIYGSAAVQAYSFGSYSQIDKTDTEVFEDVFCDAMESAGEESKIETKQESITLGVPAGVEIEGMDEIQQSAQSGQSTGGSGGSDDSEDEDYDEMDLNQDGTVSASERLIYEATHPSANTDSTVDSLNLNSKSISNALSAYMAA